MKNTIKSIYNHKHVDLLNNFGKADITYNINFKIIEKILKNFNLKISGKTIKKNFFLILEYLKEQKLFQKIYLFQKKQIFILELKD